MKKILFMLGVFVLFVSCDTYAQTKVVKTYTDIPRGYDNYSMYNSDLAAVEDYLFGGSYKNDTLSSRFNRIERKLFSKCYPNLNPAQRMNNILANYRDNDNNTYLSDYYGSNRNPAQRILNRFLGQPTGFTPPIMNSPFDYGGFPAGINRGIYNNRGGYAYRNEMPASAGFGVHILDD